MVLLFRLFRKSLLIKYNECIDSISTNYLGKFKVEIHIQKVSDRKLLPIQLITGKVWYLSCGWLKEGNKILLFQFCFSINYNFFFHFADQGITLGRDFSGVIVDVGMTASNEYKIGTIFSRRKEFQKILNKLFFSLIF